VKRGMNLVYRELDKAGVVRYVRITEKQAETGLFLWSRVVCDAFKRKTPNVDTIALQYVTHFKLLSDGRRFRIY
jgi:hypothetical protein